ncbi:MAG: hypothetical protein SFV23_27190 [Planctomycetaceae bacterium]|nr:hypothetical protein [Planctomycetaceae bacterium]
MNIQPWSRIAALTLVLGLTSVMAEAQSSKPEKAVSKADDADSLRRRLEALEAELAAARRELKSSPAARFQMLKAGERVVILDTETGKTQIIDPEPQTALQKVDVGKAWVVVTVLGNASLRHRPPPPPLPEN